MAAAKPHTQSQRVLWSRALRQIEPIKKKFGNTKDRRAALSAGCHFNAAPRPICLFTQNILNQLS